MAKKKKVCESCGGDGYLVIYADNVLRFVHGNTPKSGGNIPEIQSCDTCDKHTAGRDDRAQLKFLKDVVAGKARLPQFLLLWGAQPKEKHRG